jgi:hypothetical protein
MEDYKSSRIVLLLIAIFVVVQLHAQSQTISGRVMDAETGESLAFVNIVINDSHQGVATDIDGRFSIKAYKPVDFLK